jgi:hypothetical protein
MSEDYLWQWAHRKESRNLRMEDSPEYGYAGSRKETGSAERWLERRK